MSFSLAALGLSLVGTPANALLGLDSTPPSVTRVKPSNGPAVSGQVSIEASADDGLLGSGVSRVEYQVDTADGAWTALSGSLLSTTYRGSNIFSSAAYRDPETPVFTVKAGTPYRIRVVQPSGHARQHAFTLHGAEWMHDAWQDGSGSDWIGSNTRSCAVGTQDGMSVMKAWNFMPLYGAGGPNAIPGDYLYRDQANAMLNNGLWGIVRVTP